MALPSFIALRNSLKQQLHAKLETFVPYADIQLQGSNPSLEGDGIRQFHPEGHTLDFFSYKGNELQQLYDLTAALHPDALDRTSFVHGVLGLHTQDREFTSAKILAILIVVDVAADSQAWRKILSTPVNADFCDRLLPLERNKGVRFFGKEWFQKFDYEQDCFCPIALEYGKATTGYDYPKRPLPYVGQEDLLGKGAFGSVYKVKIAGKGGLDGMFARKDIPLKDTSAKVEWLVAQYLAHGAVKHENIIKSFARLDLRGTVSIFMELAARDLEQHMKSKEPQGPAAHKKISALRIIAELAGALDFLHHRLRDQENRPVTFIHLDLKPKNILVSEEASGIRLKVADFGISHVKYGEKIAATRFPYTRATVDQVNSCVAPEGLLDHEPKGTRSDVWSFGCILAIYCSWIDDGWNGVTRFQRERAKSQDRRTDRFAVEPNTLRGRVKKCKEYEVNPSVATWFTALCKLRKSTILGEQLADVWSMLQLHVLRPDPKHRKDMDFVANQLDNIASKVRHIPNTIESSRGGFASIFSRRKTFEWKEQVPGPSATPVSPSTTAWPLEAEAEAKEMRTGSVSSGSTVMTRSHSNPRFRLPFTGNSEDVMSCSVSKNGVHVALLSKDDIWYFNLNNRHGKPLTTSRELEVSDVFPDSKWAFCHLSETKLFAVPRSESVNKFRIAIYSLENLADVDQTIRVSRISDDVPCQIELLASHPFDIKIIACAVRHLNQHRLMILKLGQLGDKTQAGHQNLTQHTDEPPILVKVVCFRTSENLKQAFLSNANDDPAKLNNCQSVLVNLQFSPQGTALYLANQFADRCYISRWDLATKTYKARMQLMVQESQGPHGPRFTGMSPLGDRIVLAITQGLHAWSCDLTEEHLTDMQPVSSRESLEIRLVLVERSRSTAYIVRRSQRDELRFGVYRLRIDPSSPCRVDDPGEELATTAMILNSKTHHRPIGAALVSQEGHVSGPKLILVDHTGHVEILILPVVYL